MHAYLFATGSIVCLFMLMLSHHPYRLWVYKIACKYRVACSGLIYRKTLALSKEQIDNGLRGTPLNLLGNDLNRADYGISAMAGAARGPLEVILLGYIIYNETGLSGLVGILFLISFLPLQSKYWAKIIPSIRINFINYLIAAYIGKQAASIRSKTAKCTDERVQKTNEIIQGIQVIKMFGWEHLFTDLLNKIRRSLFSLTCI